MKLAIIYQTSDGIEKLIAEKIAEGAAISKIAKIQTMNIDSIDHAFLVECQIVIFGCAVNNGDISWQMKKWLEAKYTKGQLAGKLASIFGITETQKNGGENALINLTGQLLNKGLFVFTMGKTKEPPYYPFGYIANKDNIRENDDSANIFGKQITKKAIELFLQKKHK